jgi:hypothetical protein
MGGYMYCQNVYPGKLQIRFHASIFTGLESAFYSPQKLLILLS